MLLNLLVVLLHCSFSYSARQQQSINRKEFPEGFMFGVGSSAYQIEGAWNEDGKSENIWDYMLHTKPEMITDKSNADVTCNSYHKLDTDIVLLKNLGVDHFKISLSWSRILPSGFPNKINKLGVDYYNKVINKLLENNIQPMVTLYHWDLPQSLQHLGGFTNNLIKEWFQDYAKVAFDLFGDRVKLWITFNEPQKICEFGYGVGDSAPGIKSSGVGFYLCSHHLLLAHATVYHMYNNTYKSTQEGKIGIAVDSSWHEPASNRTEDIEAALRQYDFEVGIYTEPIFSQSGDYPKALKQRIANRSKKEGFKSSRLPNFTPDQISFVKSTSDYFGLNHYSTAIVSHKEDEPIGDPSTSKDMNVNYWQDPTWPHDGIIHFKSVPWGFRKLLNFLKNRYENPVIYVMENGFPATEPFNDQSRVDYHIDYLSTLLDAIYEDDVNIRSYTVWSFLDSFEWTFGYTASFGLYHVNFTDPNRPRTEKLSAKVFKEIVKQRKLPSIYN